MADTQRSPTREQRFGTLPSGRPRFVSAAYDDLDNAIDATRDLEAREYDRHQISVFMATKTREWYIDTHPRNDEVEENAVVVKEVELKKQRKTLVGAGMTEYRARRFEELVKDGHVLVGVVAETDPERTNIAEVLEKHGGALVGTEGSEKE